MGTWRRTYKKNSLISILSPEEYKGLEITVFSCTSKLLLNLFIVIAHFFVRDIPVEQLYNRTALKRSDVRPWDDM